MFSLFRTISGVVIGICLFFSISAKGQSPEELLASLKAKDQQLDNSILSYRCYEEAKIKLGMTPEEDKRAGLPFRNPEIRTLKGSIDCQLVSRGNEAILIGRLSKEQRDKERKELKADISTITAAAFTKYSNVGGQKKMFSDYNYPEDSQHTCDYLIFPIDPDFDLMKKTQMQIEFAHGVGFGKRILQIDTFEKEENSQVHIKGKMLLWKTDITTFDLVVDQNLIVRKGKVDSHLRDAFYTIDINTSGTVNESGLCFPQSGSLVWYLYARDAEGNQVGERRIWAQSSIEFKGIKLGISEKEFKKLAEVYLPDGTFIQDQVSGLSYTKGGTDDPFLEK